KQAFEVHAHRESAALAARGLALLETLPESRDRDRRELALQVAAGAALRLTRGYGGTEVGKAYRRAALLSERARDDRYLVLILRGLWEYHELGRPAGIAQTMFFTAWVHQLLGDLSASLAGTEELISLCDDHGLPMYLAAGRLLQGELRVGQGRAEEGLALMREGIAGHRASGTEPGSSVCSGGWLAEGLLSVGASAEAARLVDEALAFVER